MMVLHKFRLLPLLIFTISAPASACWDSAAQRYDIPASLLYAIAKTESNLNPYAMNRNKNGSYDIGLMQINSSWLPTLKKFGITESKLLNNYCVNIEVGAWILRQSIAKHGYNWNAIGAYNATNPDKRALYAWRVAKNLYPTELARK